MKWIYLILLTLIWGSSFILIKIGVQGFSPIQVGSLRVGIAGLILLPIALLSFKKIPLNKWKWIVISGALGNFFPMFLFPIAETKLSSSLAGVLNSLTPIFVLILGYLVYNIKSTFWQIIGAIIGFLGAFVLIIFSTNSNLESDNYIFSIFLIIATMMYGMSALLIKKHLTSIPSLQLSSVLFSIFLIPSFLILIFSNFFSEFKGTHSQWNSLAFIIILSVFGTAIAMILFYKLISISSAVFASSVTFIMPIVAIGWGILFGESINLFFIVGVILILIGVYLIQVKKIKT